MKNATTRFLFAALIAVMLGGGTLANADDGMLGAYWWRGHYPWVDWSSAYRAGRIPVPPYYALHPPVYYGSQVRRPYGYSPYANYPVMQPTRVLAFEQPVVGVPGLLIENPYLPPQAPAAAKNSVAAPQPTLVLNPFAPQNSPQSDAPLPVIRVAGAR